MIQILGIRYFADTGKKAETFFDKGWRAKSVRDLFLELPQIMATIPEDEHYNLYYTISDCLEETGRKLESQSYIPFDIDGIDLDRINDYIDPFLRMAGDLSYSDTGIVFSGNGIQFIIGTNEAITDTAYFKKTRKYYKIICDRINLEYARLGLPGGADPSVWSPARLMRLPMTTNIKTPETGYARKNSTKNATLEQPVIKILENYTIPKAAGIVEVDDADQIPAEQLRRFPDPDSKTVRKECGFLNHCMDNQKDIIEEDWYKMLSIIGRLEGGIELVHKYSEKHPHYTPSETAQKLEQAMLSSGPRTCKNIEQNYTECQNCPHYGRILSPILLKGEDFISTGSQGYRHVQITPSGQIKTGKPNYDDLLRQFKKDHDFVVTAGRELYTWTGTHWSRTTDMHVNVFMEKYVAPKPTRSECIEFDAKVFRNNVADEDFFHRTTFKKINVQNGVLDISGDKAILVDHNTEFGFTSVLPYEYDPLATCTRFEKFLCEITLDREELKIILMEYMGYIFANEVCTYAKCLILLGGGSNGKSTLMNVMKKLAGKDNYSGVSMARLDNPQYTAHLQHKLFNMTEETPSRGSIDSAEFKNLVSGGDIMVKVVYKPPHMVTNRTKLVIASNSLPWMNDTTKGMFRRLLIVPFDASFEGKKQDVGIEGKLFDELPGILNSIITYYQEFKKRGSFLDSSVISEQADQYRRENDEVFQFVDDHVEIFPQTVKGKFLQMGKMYASFTSFCEGKGIRYVKSDSEFGKALKNIIPDAVERSSRRFQGKRGYHGLELTNNHTDF